MRRRSQCRPITTMFGMILALAPGPAPIRAQVPGLVDSYFDFRKPPLPSDL
jgi:hypothetical protein